MTDKARLYGGSLYELAAGENLEDAVKQQMDQIRRLFRENPDYVKLLGNPSIPLPDRCGLIEEAFGQSAERYLVSFLKLLCERGLMWEYAGCCDEFTARYNAQHGIVEAVVTSAVPLTEEQREKLTRKLSSISGRQVCLTERVDSSVIAGLRVEMEGKQFDGTAAGRVAGISRKLETLVL